MDMLFIVLLLVSYGHLTKGVCPNNCKSDQVCDAADKGCPLCDREYYGRQCQHRTECRYTDKGAEYRGKQSTTETGKTCQRWELDTPHNHGKHSQEENYCRNPDNEPGPWCYTTDPDKRWELCDIPMCDTQCPLPVFDSAGVDITNPPPDGFKAGFIATMGCVSGFELPSAGNPTNVECQNDLTWSSTLPKCNKVKCPTPSLKTNSKLESSQSVFEYQDSITILCEDGYTIQGNNKLTCQADKTWSYEFPSCKINECAAPTIPNSSLTDKKDKYVYQDMVTVTCDTGYTLQGQEKMQCQADKTWSNLPTCKVNECPKPAFNNGSIAPSQGIYTYQDTITLSCDVGHTLQGSQTSQCQANKSWSSLPTCKINECSVPTLSDHSSIKMKKEVYYYSESITIVCDTGYDLKGKSELTCQADTSWSDAVPTCQIVECTSPTLNSRSEIHSSTRKLVYQYKDEISIVCEMAYVIQGSQKMTCQADRTWDVESPTCKIIECPVPKLPTETNINNPNATYVYGYVIRLSCAEDYELKDGDTSICQATGNWKDLPVCEKKSSSAGVVIGAVIGSLLAVALVVIIIIFVWRRKKRFSSGTSEAIVFHDVEKPLDNGKEPPADNVYANIRDSSVARESKVLTQSTNEDTYYNFEAPSEVQNIKTENLRNYIRLKKGDAHFFDNEFKTLPVGLQRPTDAAKRPRNRQKNKYKNIYPYDDNRITLKPLSGVPDSDYINASPIKGYNGKIKYIAAQGPQDLTHGDFWRMVLEQKIRTIAMLTNPFENAVKKCIQYWPEKDSLTIEGITVDLQSSDEFADFTIRRLKLSEGEDISFVHQYHFTTWPDKGVPKCPSVLAQFHKKVFDMAVHGAGPVLVHCSAGIGRTGTFIALDYLLDEAADTASVGVHKALKTLREQRVNMVQTKEQYTFLHDVLADALDLRSSAITAAEFPDKYKRLLTRNKETGKTLLQQEYESMKESTSYLNEDAFTVGKREENKKKNRYSNILPTDANRVFISGSGVDDSYINAVFMPGYRDRHAYIVTQTPLPNTMEDFWKLIFDENVISIIMLNDIPSAEEIYWPEENPLQFGNITVTLLCTESENDCQTLSFQLCRDNEKHVVKQYQAKFWPDIDSAPSTTSSMLKLIDWVQMWQHQNESRPTVVHCMNGADKSGLFCSAMVILDRLKSEQDIVIEPVIKQLRSIRPQIIPNMEQFQFCYELVGAYINSFETYSNFM